MEPNPQIEIKIGAIPKATVIWVFKLVGISTYSSNHKVGAIILGKSEKNLEMKFVFFTSRVRIASSSERKYLP